MTVRTLKYTVEINGISPAVEQFAGSQGDIKATRLEFILSDELLNSLPEQDKLLFRFDGYDGEGNVFRGDSFTAVEPAVLSYTLPEAVTRYGGRICVYLVISVVTESGTEMELYSFPALMRLNSLPSGGETAGERESFTGLAESAKQSKETALGAAERAESAAERLDGDNLYYFDGGDAAGGAAELYEETTEEAAQGSPLPITSGGVYEIEKRLSQSITNMRTEIFAQLYPIGSVLTFHDSDDHSAHLGFIWERFAVGKTLVGIDGGDSDFNTVGNSGGEKEHTLAVIEMPSHTHDITVRFLRDTVNTGSTLRHTDVGTESVINTGVTAGKTGGNQPHNNMPPYIVTSFWIRRG